MTNKPIQNGEETDKRHRSGRFASGNKASPGRPPGRGPAAELRAVIGKDLLAIVKKLTGQALTGDVQAARILLERVLPPVKAIEQTVALQLPEGGTLTAQGRAVLSAVACGELAPSQGAALLGAIGTLARVTELDELTARITALEAAHAKP